VNETPKEKSLGGTLARIVIPGGRRRINARGDGRGANRPNLPPKKRVRLDPKARDADGDGLLQDGTTAERAARAGRAPSRRVLANANEGVRDIEAVKPEKPKKRVVAQGDKKPVRRKPLPPRGQQRPAPVAAPEPEQAAEPAKRIVAQPANKRPNRRPLPPRRRAPNAPLPAPRAEERQNTPPPRIQPDPAPLPDFMDEGNLQEAERQIREGIMRGNRPKVTSLRSADFTTEERDLINRGTFEVAQDWDLWFSPDKWNSVNEVAKKLEALRRERLDATDEQDRTVSRLRDTFWLGKNKDKIRDEQLQYMLRKERIAALANAYTVALNRHNVLRNRKTAESLLDQLNDPNVDLDQRGDILKELETMKAIEFRDVQNFDVIEGESAFWANIKARTAVARKKYDADLFQRNGPQELEDIINFGGRRMRAEQDEIDRLVDDINDDRDDSAAKVRLEDKLSDLKAEADALGAESILDENDPDLDIRKLENNKRRFLKKNISKIENALSGGQNLMSYYGFGPKKKPSVVGSIAEGNSPKTIVSKNISTAEQAAEFVRNGGSLDDVPNKFWGYALKANSSESKNDKSTRFRQIPPNGGAIGFTLIFQARDEQGKPTQTGWVIKAASDRETVGEVLSQNLMREHGFMVDGGGYDGTVEELDALGRERNARRAGRSDTFAVLPFALNAAPEGEAELGGNSNYDPYIFDGTPDAALPARLHGMLHNYMMSVADRHRGNGFTVMTPQGPMVIPIDQGWAGQARYSVDEYMAWGYGMDGSLDSTIRDHLYNIARNDAAEAKKQLEAVTAVYDGMIERAEAVMSRGRDGFTQLAAASGTRLDMNEVSERIEELYDMYKKNLDGLKQSRGKMIASFTPRNM